MKQVVLDASALTALYITGDSRRAAVGRRLRGGRLELLAPAHLDSEVVSALRRVAHRSRVMRRTAPTALRHLQGLMVRRMPVTPFVDRMWELRTQLTSYDAAYVALAETFKAPLVTCDRKLTRATLAQCEFDLVE